MANMDVVPQEVSIMLSHRQLSLHIDVNSRESYGCGQVGRVSWTLEEKCISTLWCLNEGAA
jgi:hypothetical protein